MKAAFSVLTALFPALLFAQQTFDLQGTKTISEKNSAIFELYDRNIGHGAAIFNGPEYTGGDPTIEGHQFFQSRNYHYGTVIYRGYKFDSLVLNYDIVDDKLVVVQSNSGEFLTISPDSRLVSAFIIPGHVFIRFPEIPEGLREGGYYELLYDGDTRVLAKRRKRVGESREKNYINGYKVSDRYFVYHNGEYHQVGTRKAVLDLFKSDKKALKAFIRSNNLRFTDSPEFFLVKIGEYIDTNTL